MSLRSQFKAHKSKLGLSTNRAASLREKRKLLQARREKKRKRQEQVDKMKMPPPSLPTKSLKPPTNMPPPHKTSRPEMPPPPPILKSMEKKPSGVDKKIKKSPITPQETPAPALAVKTKPVRDYRALLLDFYTEFNPSKVSSVDNLLEKYKGKEPKLLKALCKKYPGAKLMLGERGQKTGVAAAPTKSTSDDNNSEEQSKEKSLNELLPKGFFDDSGTATEAASNFQRGSITNEIKALEKKETETMRGRLSDRQVQINPGKAIPVGFFDDKKADAIAHNIDPKILAKQAKEAQWSEFEKFAATVKQEEDDDRDFEEVQQEDRERYEQIMLGQHRDRVASLRAKWQNRKVAKTVDGAKSSVQDPQPSFDDVADRKEIDITKILQSSKRKQEEKLESLRKQAFTPLDPLNWRLKHVN